MRSKTAALLKKPKRKSPGLLNDSLNTETPPVPPRKKQAPPCTLCHWLEKRMSNTGKELITHMEKYHLT